MKLLNVEIDRAAGLVIPKLVYDFEYPVLEVIHGEENLRVLSDEDADEAMTAERALTMLNARYAPEAVKAVYKNSRDLARITGLEGGGEAGEKDVQASVKVRAPEKPAKKATAKKAE